MHQAGTTVREKKKKIGEYLWRARLPFKDGIAIIFYFWCGLFKTGMEVTGENRDSCSADTIFPVGGVESRREPVVIINCVIDTVNPLTSQMQLN